MLAVSQEYAEHCSTVDLALRKAQGGTGSMGMVVLAPLRQACYIANHQQYVMHDKELP